MQTGEVAAPRVSSLTGVLVADPRVSLEEHDGLANATLRIKDMDFEDRAAYMCLATNEFGSGNSTIMVRVKGQCCSRGALSPCCGRNELLTFCHREYRNS